MKTYFFGVDIGSQGARVILVDQNGTIIKSGTRKFDLNDSFRQEQCPNMWWNNTVEIIDELLEDPVLKIDKQNIKAIAVTSTSGTVIPLDKEDKPIYKAIMYSDSRSVEQGKRIQNIVKRLNFEGYTGFNSSSGISKILWFVETFPDKIKNIATWIHASDFIVGKLCGNYKVTDYTNVLKSGYDLDKFKWPNFLFDDLNLKREWFQDVVASGTVIGFLDQYLANRWGIKQLKVVVGITDGCASQIAAGAVSPGDWNTTIGTTLVIKGVTHAHVKDPLGRIYSHRHSEGYWMPGGASNTGADWISINFNNEDLEQLNTSVENLIPTKLMAWPLLQEGERFPIMAPSARKIEPITYSKEQLYAANLEGVAFIEKLAYEIIEDLSKEIVSAVYTAGGGSNSDVWLKIRASVLNVPIHKCKEPSGALGASIVAASNTYYNSITEAAKIMTSIEKTIIPNENLKKMYASLYIDFKNKLKELNYL